MCNSPRQMVEKMVKRTKCNAAREGRTFFCSILFQSRQFKGHKNSSLKIIIIIIAVIIKQEGASFPSKFQMECRHTPNFSPTQLLSSHHCLIFPSRLYDHIKYSTLLYIDIYIFKKKWGGKKPKRKINPNASLVSKTSLYKCLGACLILMNPNAHLKFIYSRASWAFNKNSCKMGFLFWSRKPIPSDLTQKEQVRMWHPKCFLLLLLLLQDPGSRDPEGEPAFRKGRGPGPNSRLSLGRQTSVPDPP